MRAGTIVICEYINFTGEKHKGLFMVLCDENNDNSNEGHVNFTAIKITSNLDMIGNYTVYLDNEENPFFDKPCLASCGKIHTLHKNQIKYVLGTLSANSFKKVFSTTCKFLFEIARQMLKNV